jgi:ribosomal protein S18 acetylase RimI-like enzyme
MSRQLDVLNDDSESTGSGHGTDSGYSGSEYEITEITPDLLHSVQILHRQNFPDLWKAFAFGLSHSSFGYLLYSNGQLSGEATLQWFLLNGETLCLYLGTLSIVARCRQRGFGSHLLEHVRAECPSASSIFLHVLASNDVAIAFYENNGFRRVKLVQNFYSDLPSNDAFLYEWKNPNPGPAPPEIIHHLKATRTPLPQLLDGWDGEYEVEKIVDARRRCERVQYLVKWAGYKDLTWESADNLNCPAKVDAYWKMEKAALMQEVTQNVTVLGAKKVHGKVKYLCQFPDGTQEEMSGKMLRVQYCSALFKFLRELSAGDETTQTRAGKARVDK